VVSVEQSDGQVMPPYDVFSCIWTVDNALTNLDFNLRLKLVRVEYKFIWPHSQRLDKVTDSYHFLLLWPTICCLLFWWHVWHQRRSLYWCECLTWAMSHAPPTKHAMKANLTSTYSTSTWSYFSAHQHIIYTSIKLQQHYTEV